MGKFIDLTGKRYGRLLVARRHDENDGGGKPLWVCKCDCGKYTIVRGYSLKSGNTKSCGCFKVDTPSNTRHSGCGTRLYRIYKGIKQRCLNERLPGFADYGGRGIKICDEWRDNFDSFRDWALSNGYVENNSRTEYTVDRIDVNGDYSPDNCRFVSQKMQTRNTRRTRYATYDGVTKSIGEWAEELSLPYNTVYFRARNHNWTLDKE